MGKPGTKIRSKAPQIRTSPAPKADAANQTQIKPYSNLQQHHIVANKMLVVNNSGAMTTMTQGSPMTADKVQQIVNQQNKQSPQQQATQQVLMQQAIQQQQQQTMQQYQLQQGQQPQHIQPKPMMSTFC